MTANATWMYSYDGENRLIEMESQASIPDEAKRRLLLQIEVRRAVWLTRRSTLM